MPPDLPLCSAPLGGRRGRVASGPGLRRDEAQKSTTEHVSRKPWA